MLWADKSGLVCIGIPGTTFERHSRFQIQVQDRWCWAACVEMVATFLGFNTASQAEIVEDMAHGLQINRSGSVDEVRVSLENLASLSNKRFSVSGATSREVDASTLTADALGQELSSVLTKEMPWIALIGTNNGVGHFVVVTEIRYRTKPAKAYTQVVYYDPWPVEVTQSKARGLATSWSLFHKKLRFLVTVDLAS